MDLPGDEDSSGKRGGIFHEGTVRGLNFAQGSAFAGDERPEGVRPEGDRPRASRREETQGGVAESPDPHAAGDADLSGKFLRVLEVSVRLLNKDTAFVSPATLLVVGGESVFDPSFHAEEQGSAPGTAEVELDRGVRHAAREKETVFVAVEGENGRALAVFFPGKSDMPSESGEDFSVEFAEAECFGGGIRLGEVMVLAQGHRERAAQPCDPSTARSIVKGCEGTDFSILRGEDRGLRTGKRGFAKRAAGHDRAVRKAHRGGALCKQVDGGKIVCHSHNSAERFGRLKAEASADFGSGIQRAVEDDRTAVFDKGEKTGFGFRVERSGTQENRTRESLDGSFAECGKCACAKNRIYGESVIECLANKPVVVEEAFGLARLQKHRVVEFIEGVEPDDGSGGIGAFVPGAEEMRGGFVRDGVGHEAVGVVQSQEIEIFRDFGLSLVVNPGGGKR